MARNKPKVPDVDASAFPVSIPTLRGRLITHLKKWWWAHLIVLIVVVLVTVLPIVYVAYPKIAQNGINDSTLNITSVVVRDPTPTTVHLALRQVIGTKSSFHPIIYGFNAAVWLLGTAGPFATIRVPQVKSRDGARVLVDQALELNNVDLFSDVAKAFMLEDKIQLNIYGKPDLREGGLPRVALTYNKTISIQGLNRLKGFRLHNLHITGPEAGGSNAEGKLSIPNPSVLTLSVGNVTMALSIDGHNIGTAFMKNLIIRPGMNQIPMTANVDQVKMVALTVTRGKGFVVPVDITASVNASMYDGKTLPYFSNALAANNLTAEVDVREVVGNSLHELLSQINL